MNSNYDPSHSTFIISNALASLQNQDLNKALYYCQQTTTHNSFQSALIKSITGVIHMFSNNLIQAIEHFNDGIKIINSSQTIEDHLELSLSVKLNANLLLAYIMMGRHNESILLVNDLLQWINNLEKQKKIEMFEQLLYVLFRVTRLDSLTNVNLDHIMDQHTKASILSAASFNAQLAKKPQQAYRLQGLALQLWRKLKQYGCMIISLRRIICLAIDLKQDDEEYQNQLTQIFQSQTNIQRKTLFKGYKERINLLKEVLKLLYGFQKDEIKGTKPTKDDTPECWKLAVKLKLSKTIREIKGTTTPKGQENNNNINYLKDTIHKIQTQNSKIVERSIKKSQFVKNSITFLSNHVANLTIHCQRMRVALLKQVMRDIINMKPKQREPLKRISIQNVSQYQSHKGSSSRTRTPTANISRSFSRKQSLGMSPSHNSSSLSIKPDQKFSKKVSKCLRMCEVGHFLQKKNFSSDGGNKKFVKVTKNQIRWATDQNKIDNEGSFHFYDLREVRGILYGKFSQTFKKSSNKGLNSWKCFSLVLQKRTLDFYVEDQKDVQFWISGISAALKRAQPQRELTIYTQGRQRWRKMFLKLTQSFIEPMKKHQRLHHNDVAKAIILFGKNNYKLK